jgi:predicted O-linked N-acetylglucosamine transferase (SPINDLY family)
MNETASTILSEQLLENAKNCFQQGNYSAGLTILESYLQTDPASWERQWQAGFVYINGGFDEYAQECFKQSLALGAPPAVKLTLAMTVPQILPNTEDAEKVMSGSLSALRALKTESITVGAPIKLFKQLLHFRFSYYGYNVKDLHKELAEVFIKWIPHLEHTAHHCQPNHQRTPGKYRIGIVLRYHKGHAMGRAFQHILKTIASTDNIVCLFSTTPFDYLNDFQCSTEILPYHLGAARQKIEAFEPDLLIYTEIGMDPLTYFLAFSRLAATQCIMGGHPVTSGIPNMDYYLTHSAVEAPDAQLHYTEKVIGFKGIAPTDIFISHKPPQIDIRKSLHIPADTTIYYCPHNNIKIHPEFDGYLADILDADPSGIILMLDLKNHRLSEKLKKRFAVSLGERISRIYWHPLLEAASFVSVLSISAVVLDTIHFGMGTTAFFSLGANIPIVTQCGRFLRTRFISTVLSTIGLSDCITYTKQDYVKQAIKLGTDSAYRLDVQERIRKNGHKALENQEFLAELSDFINQHAQHACGLSA